MPHSHFIVIKSVDTTSGTSQSTPTISLTLKKRVNSAARTQSSLRLLFAFLYERCIDWGGTEAPKQAQQEKSERGEHKAENIRYGEAVSEHGFGGETTDNSGDAQQQGCGRTEESKGAEETTQTRSEQGYGKGLVLVHDM